MKSVLPYTILVLLISIAFTATGQTTPKSLDYMNDLFEPVQKTKASTLKYLQAITRGRSAEKVEKMREILINEIKTIRSGLERKKGFNGKEDFKNALYDFLNVKIAILEEDYEQIVNMDKIKEQSYDAMEAYIRAQEAANKKLEDAFDQVKAAQKDFADQHHIKLIEFEGDEVDKKIEKAGQVIAYYNEVYLLFFRSYLQEGYVFEAVETEDIAAIEQGRNALASFAKEDLKKLEALDPFAGDDSMIEITKEVLAFYLEEAETDFADQIDFLLMKDEMKKLEIKANQTRKRKDIDAYNDMIPSINKAAEELNKKTATSNNLREKLFDQWNKTGEKFMSTHGE